MRRSTGECVSRPGGGITRARVTTFRGGRAGWKALFRRLTWEAAMTSATIRHARDASRGEGSWMIVFAAVLLGMLAIAQMFFIPAYPFWSLMIIAVDVVALWGLCAYGSRQNLAS
jgi:hypothetical protein